MKPPVEVRALAYLVLIMLVTRVGMEQIPKHIPFFEFLDVGPGDRWGQGINLLFFAGTATAFTGRYFSIGCLLAGGTLVLKTLVNMPAYSNGTLFDGLILVLCGLCQSQRGTTLLRAQCVLVYVGTGLSKMIDADWWNGRSMAATFDYHPSANWVPDWFAQPAGIASIFTESSIAVLLLFPATRNWAVLLVAAFHTGILVILSEDFTTFYYTVAIASTLLFLQLPKIKRIVTPQLWLASYSVFSGVREARRSEGNAVVQFASGSLSGFPAILFQMLSCLPVLGLLLAINCTVARHGFPRLRDAIVTASVLATFFAAWRIRIATRE